MAGRKPKPTRLKVLQGNPGKRQLNDREPKPEPVTPECPEHLSVEAKHEWDAMSRKLHKLGLLTDVDRAALAAYCQAWGRWVDAERMLTQYGSVVKAPSGYLIQSPYLAIANKALAQMMRILTEFGMTPSSRSRIAVPEGEPDGDAFDAFLRGGPGV